MDFRQRFEADFTAALNEMTGEPPLFLAASAGDVDRFKRLLEDPRHRAELNVDNSMIGIDCLNTAINMDYREIARALVSLPLSEFDFRRHPLASHGAIPLLHCAAVMSRFEIFMIMVDSGKVDITESDPQGMTPLAHASDAGCTRIVQYLLQQEAVKPDEKDDQGRTPLSYAAEWGNKDIVQMLLRIDVVSPDSADVEGNTPFYFAVRRGHGAIAQILVDTGRVNRDVEGRAQEDRRADQLRGPTVVIEEVFPF